MSATPQAITDWDPGTYDRFRGPRLRPALDLMRAGKIATRGLIKQEDIALDTFLANRFGRIFASGAATPASVATTAPRAAA